MAAHCIRRCRGLYRDSEIYLNFLSTTDSHLPYHITPSSRSPSSLLITVTFHSSLLLSPTQMLKNATLKTIADSTVILHIIIFSVVLDHTSCQTPLPYPISRFPPPWSPSLLLSLSPAHFSLHTPPQPPRLPPPTSNTRSDMLPTTSLVDWVSPFHMSGAVHPSLTT